MSLIESGTGRAAIRRTPIYLAAFCILFPLSIFNLHSDYYNWQSLVPSFVLLLALGGAALLLVRRINVDRQLPPLIVLTLLIALFPRSIATMPVFFLLAIAGIASAGLALLRRRAHASPALHLPANFTYFANLLAIALAAAIAWPAIDNAVSSSRAADEIVARHSSAVTIGPAASHSGKLPHIVHIVLDGYSRADVLEEVYGFDNTQFLDALRQRGFHVVDKATAPFNQTLLTMSSIFSLGPVVDPATFDGASDGVGDFRRTFRKVMRSGTVPRMLAQLDYDLRSSPTAFVGLQHANPVMANGDPVPFGVLGIAATYAFTYELLLESPLLAKLAARAFGAKFDIISLHYGYLREISERRLPVSAGRPVFFYQHILAPHPPFNISPDGERRPLGVFPRALVDNSKIVEGSEIRRAEYRKGYLDKLRYINRAVLHQVDNIKSSTSEPLIIIVHSDHGGGLHTEEQDKAKTCLKERFGALLAVYASDERVLSEFGDGFEIANLYRAIFRSMLNADLPDVATGSIFVDWQFDRASPVEPEEFAAACPPPPDRLEHMAKPAAHHLHRQ